MIVYPYYALFQALVLPPVGAAYYLWLWCRRRTLQPPGRYRIGFRRGWLDAKKRMPYERAAAYADLDADRWAA
jgi:hypothetical protein